MYPVETHYMRKTCSVHASNVLQCVSTNKANNIVTQHMHQGNIPSVTSPAQLGMFLESYLGSLISQAHLLHNGGYTHAQLRIATSSPRAPIAQQEPQAEAGARWCQQVEARGG